MPTSSSDSYHHGNLKSAMVKAAEELIREDGVEGFSLRKAANRAGVSPGASAHHFKGVKELLTKVAIRAFKQLQSQLEALPKWSNSAVNLRAQAQAYVTFAANNPGLFQLMCRIDLIDYEDNELVAASMAAMVNYGKAASAYFGTEEFSIEKRELQPQIMGAFATAYGLAHMIYEGRPQLLLNKSDSNSIFIEQVLPKILEETWPDKK